jgi:hypothetical protein
MKLSKGLIETLDLTEHELQVLLQRVDDHPDETSNRQYLRTPYHVRDGVIVEIVEEDGPQSCARVAPRDISAGGIGLLHRGPLSGGTNVALHLPASDKQLRLVHGQVVRCFGLIKDVYDVGVAFNEKVDVEQILAGAAAGPS